MAMSGWAECQLCIGARLFHFASGSPSPTHVTIVAWEFAESPHYCELLLQGEALRLGHLDV